MKHMKLIIMSLIMILMFCMQSMAQSSSGFAVNGNVGAAPFGFINNGAHVYPIGEYGAGISQPLLEFVCNSMSACGAFDMAWTNNGAIVNLGKVGSGAIVNLGGG